MSSRSLAASVLMAALAGLSLAACGGDEDSSMDVVDAGAPLADASLADAAGPEEEDASAQDPDASEPVDEDAGTVSEDAGATADDAGALPDDAGTVSDDAGSASEDAGDEDAGDEPSDSGVVQDADAASADGDASALDEDAGDASEAEEDAGSISDDAGSIIETEDAGSTDEDAGSSTGDAGTVQDPDADVAWDEGCVPEAEGSLPPLASRTGEFSEVFPDGCGATVRAWRVAQKKGSGDYAVLTRFKAFEVEGFDAKTLHDSRIAVIDDPAVHENVVFMAAGQKGPSGSGHSNGLTGQGMKWFAACDDVKCDGVELSGKSLSMKLRALGWLPSGSTYLALSLDNNFDYTMSDSKRDAVARGYAAWVKSKITADTKRVVLAGSSRGGCLSMLIAQSIRADRAYDGVEVSVSSFDGVCNRGDELGVTFTKIANPVRRSGTFYGGWATDIEEQFPYREGLHVYHLSGGEEVVAMSGVRAFSAYEGEEPPDEGTDIDWGWYKQTWLPWAHKEIGSAYVVPDEEDQPQAVADTIDAQLSWLKGLLGRE